MVAVGAVRMHRADRRRADADHTGDAAHASARYHQGGGAARSTFHRFLCRASRRPKRCADDVAMLACQLSTSSKDIMVLH